MCFLYTGIKGLHKIGRHCCDFQLSISHICLYSADEFVKCPLNMDRRAGETAQWVKVPAVKSGALSLTSSSHRVEGGNLPLLVRMRMCLRVHIGHIHTCFVGVCSSECMWKTGEGISVLSHDLTSLLRQGFSLNLALMFSWLD